MKMTPPRSSHTHTVINLYRRDSNASEYALEFVGFETSDGRNLPASFPGTGWIFPSAPRVSSKRFGVDMSHCFDMWSTEAPHERGEDQIEDLRNSVATIKDIVLDEAGMIGVENIILCGINHGAVIAITVLLDMGVRLCGFVGYSTWLPKYAQSFAHTERVLQTQVSLAHCQDDDDIDIEYGEALKERLEDWSMLVTWHSYAEGRHWINEPQGVDDFVKFLRCFTCKT